MSVSFNGIPSNLMTPGVYFEFDNAYASANNPAFKMLAFGQKLTAGTAADNIPLNVTSVEQSKTWFGDGSMIARMCQAMLSANQHIDLWAIPVSDGSTVKAGGSLKSPPNASHNGVLNIKIGGDIVKVVVTQGDTPAQVATATAAAVQANGSLLVSAAVDGSDNTKTNLTAKNGGALGNDIAVSADFAASIAPTAPTLTIVQPTGGSGSPTLTSAISAMADVWYNWIAFPYNDATSLTAIEAELLDRWGPMRQIGGRAFTAYRGNHTDTATFGNGRNSLHVVAMGANESPQPPYLWSATLAAVASKLLSIDPARPLQTALLPGIQSPAHASRWTQPERNTLLQDGISTFKSNVDDTVSIERIVTMYQTNDSGFEDDSYQDIQTLETLERIRFEQRAYIASTYPRHKLADDGTDYPPGQAIVTPSIIKGELISLYQRFIDLGWVEDLAGYTSSLIVEINSSDANRMDVRDVPNIINQFRVLAGKTQFKR